MQDYCGKNGCFTIEPGDDFEGELLSVFLNSPIAYTIGENGESIRTFAAQRPDADVSFELFKDTDGVFYTGRMTVATLFAHGVKEFVSAILEHDREIGGKDELVKTIKELLDEEGAVWGIIHHDPQERQVQFLS